MFISPYIIFSSALTVDSYCIASISIVLNWIIESSMNGNRRARTKNTNYSSFYLSICRIFHLCWFRELGCLKIITNKREAYISLIKYKRDICNRYRAFKNLFKPWVMIPTRNAGFTFNSWPVPTNQHYILLSSHTSCFFPLQTYNFTPSLFCNIQLCFTHILQQVILQHF